MKQDQNTWSSPADILGKVTGGDSSITPLVNVRKFLIDNLVLNQQEKRKFETQSEQETQKKDKK
jgi:hypothetical protein